MSLSRRGRILAAWGTALLLLLGGVTAVLFISGRAGVGPLADIIGGNEENPDFPNGPPPPPLTCPLTGANPEGEVPARPALAIKVENLPASRPQTGLSWADIVYEEPVEGGITRFIAVYQCQDADRVEPIRSARLTDVDILVQFGRPVFAYSGGVSEVKNAIEAARLIDVNSVAAADAYDRDPAREAPHDLFSSTRALYREARSKIRRLGAPDPIFTYTDGQIRGRKVQEIHVPFSSASDVYWRWDSSAKAFLRWHGDEAHVSSDGTQYRAKNVIVQVVEVVLTDVVDANGVRSPKVVSVGEGVAYVLRKGKIVVGTWERKSVDDVTKFYDKKGKEVLLTPGSTWIELLPKGIAVNYG
jgi:hypothetical protein